MDQLKLFEAAFCIHQPCPVRSVLVADCFCLEIEGHPVSSRIKAVVIHQQPMFPGSCSDCRSQHRTCNDTSSFSLSVMQLVKIHSDLRSLSRRRKHLGFAPQLRASKATRTRRPRGAAFVSPPEEARRSSLRSFGFPLHKSRGHLSFCTGFQKSKSSEC